MLCYGLAMAKRKAKDEGEVSASVKALLSGSLGDTVRAKDGVEPAGTCPSPAVEPESRPVKSTATGGSWDFLCPACSLAMKDYMRRKAEAQSASMTGQERKDRARRAGRSPRRG